MVDNWNQATGMDINRQLKFISICDLVGKLKIKWHYRRLSLIIVSAQFNELAIVQYYLQIRRTR